MLQSLTVGPESMQEGACKCRQQPSWEGEARSITCIPITPPSLLSAPLCQTILCHIFSIQRFQERPVLKLSSRSFYLTPKYTPKGMMRGSEHTSCTRMLSPPEGHKDRSIVGADRAKVLGVSSSFAECRHTWLDADGLKMAPESQRGGGSCQAS